MCTTRDSESEIATELRCRRQWNKYSSDKREIYLFQTEVEKRKISGNETNTILDETSSVGFDRHDHFHFNNNNKTIKENVFHTNDQFSNDLWSDGNAAKQKQVQRKKRTAKKMITNKWLNKWQIV